MKLLFDHNISPRMISLLQDVYPNVSHVKEYHLECAEDQQVWNFAKKNNFIIVSKDSDFHQLGLLHGFPPKVIWVKLGNCTTNDIESLLRSRHEDIKFFCDDKEAAFLVLSKK